MLVAMVGIGTAGGLAQTPTMQPAAATLSATTLPTPPATTLPETSAAPTTAPTTEPTLPPLPHSDSAMDQLDAALTFTPREKTLLSSIRDKTESAEENTFYFLMAHSLKLPPLDPKDMRQLDTPARASLLRHPEAYRLRPMRLNLMITGVRKLSVATRTLTINPYWPAAMPIYAVFGYDASLRGAKPEQRAAEPIIVFTATLPPELPPGKGSIDTGIDYKYNYPEYEVACLFYKLTEQTDRGTPDIASQLRVYPNLIAWQMRRVTTEEPLPTSLKIFLAAVLALIVTAGVVVIILRKRVKKARGAENHPLFGNYQPLREESDEPSAPEPVDPELSAAAEEYLRQHPPEQDDKEGHA